MITPAEGEGLSAMQLAALPTITGGDKGLSATQLAMLPSITGGHEVVTETECAVCLDVIEDDQSVRLIPSCNHTFHLICADTWLSKHPHCPICRANIPLQFFDSSHNP